jgi:glutaminyl-tRNA synthetase
MSQENNTAEEKSLNFIEEIVENDIREGKHDGRIHTRFPPEPNGYLHIGHSKAICLSFGIAEKYNGKCNLRFDDTNPTKEDVEYVDSIKEDVRWLGFDWEDREYYTSDYFDTLYEYAVKLIKKGSAYVCEMSFEEIAAGRGTPTEPGTFSPYRDRPVEESLDLFERMKAGEFEDGKMVLRAKIGMTSSNMHMRDPIIYRIKHAHHHNTGDKWCIYPMYDFAHGQSDSIEGITHSLCTLEFEVHRPLYQWFIKELEIFPSRQIEFARLNLSYTVMSKRKLLELVEEKVVSGWDDPRMPTISGIRRRGYTPESIRNFAETIGIAKRNNVIDVALLEHCIREDLNKKALRVMGVLDPLKVVITNYPDDQSEELEAVNNPEDESMGKRKVPFSKEIYIERSDFMEDAPKKFFRLTVGKEVRLRYAYFVTCTDAIKDDQGNITELHCTYDPASKGGKSPDGRKVKGTLHWVCARNNEEVSVRLYDRLFMNENPDEAEEGKDFKSNLNPNSMKEIKAFVEPSVKGAETETKYQFERQGYFCVDKDSTPENLIFNRTVTLKDSWAKMNKR